MLDQLVHIVWSGVLILIGLLLFMIVLALGVSTIIKIVDRLESRRK